MSLAKILNTLAFASLMSLLVLPTSSLRAEGLGGPKPRITQMQQETGRPLTGYPGQNAKLMEGADTVWSRYRIGEREYFAQPNDWTCSASCYVMMFRTLVGSDISLKHAVRRCEAKVGVGANNDKVVEAMRLIGPNYEVLSGRSLESDENLPADNAGILEQKKANLAKLKKLLEEGYLVMINFREPEEHIGHYAVLQGLNDRAIQLADPYYGHHSVLSLDQFDYRSGFSKPILHGWYLAVRPLNKKKG